MSVDESEVEDGASRALGGLLGLRGQTNASVVISPLVDTKRMKYFAVDNLRLHGREVAVSWDPTGRKYPKKGCVGLCVFVDGEKMASKPELGSLRVELSGPVPIDLL